MKLFPSFTFKKKVEIFILFTRQVLKNPKKVAVQPNFIRIFSYEKFINFSIIIETILRQL